MKRKILLTSLITVCAASACAFAVTACTEYKPEKEIPGINENSVLFIENASISLGEWRRTPRR